MNHTPNTRCAHLMTSTQGEGPCESQWQKTCNPMDAHMKKKNTHNQSNYPIDQLQIMACWLSCGVQGAKFDLA